MKFKSMPNFEILKFCTGHDYSGRSYRTTLVQTLGTDVHNFLTQVFQKSQQYVEALAGAPSQDGSFAGKYALRRSHAPEVFGVAYGQGGWELGTFLRASSLAIQVTRSNDELCK